MRHGLSEFLFVVLTLTFVLFLLLVFLVIDFFSDFFLFVLGLIDGLILLVDAHSLALTSVIETDFDFAQVGLAEFLLVVHTNQVFQ